jgi:hypothetical protein
MAAVTSDPETGTPAGAPVEAPTTKKKSSKGSAFVLPALFVIAWGWALSGAPAPGTKTIDGSTLANLHWIIYFAGFVFIFSSIMHSVFAKSMAASIGWVTNGFQKELAAVSLGIGLACFYSVYNGLAAMTTVSIPIIAFLFLAGVNHVIEIVRKHNYAPNNTLILIWDFGVSISLVALLVSIGKF